MLNRINNYMRVKNEFLVGSRKRIYFRDNSESSMAPENLT